MNETIGVTLWEVTFKGLRNTAGVNFFRVTLKPSLNSTFGNITERDTNRVLGVTSF